MMSFAGYQCHARERDDDSNETHGGELFPKNEYRDWDQNNRRNGIHGDTGPLKRAAKTVGEEEPSFNEDHTDTDN